jgi:proline iminopeptidase
MTEEEGYVEVPGGRVWFRSVGESVDGRAPLLCLHGGPGFTHNYLEPLEALADRRRVIFYDQLGCGQSDRPDDLSLWTVERFVEEVAQVRAAFGLERLHLFGSSWGGEHEAAGFTACPEYQAAILGFYRKHVCRMSPWPPGFERSFAEAGYVVYNTMNGPSEFTVTGTLRTWDIMDRLAEIKVPTLLIGGRYDECTPGHMEDMHRRIAGSQLKTIEDASHLCFAEQPAEFSKTINSFFDTYHFRRPASGR